MKQTLSEWIESGEYLPSCMRDFHDAKDLFKAIDQLISVEEHDYAKSVDWVTGQCYVIDIFLWFMAHRGYTLQKSRKNVEFRDLDADLKRCKDARTKQFLALFQKQ